LSFGKGCFLKKKSGRQKKGQGGSGEFTKTFVCKEKGIRYALGKGHDFSKKKGGGHRPGKDAGGRGKGVQGERGWK